MTICEYAYYSLASVLPLYPLLDLILCAEFGFCKFLFFFLLLFVSWRWCIFLEFSFDSTCGLIFMMPPCDLLPMATLLPLLGLLVFDRMFLRTGSLSSSTSKRSSSSSSSLSRSMIPRSSVGLFSWFSYWSKFELLYSNGLLLWFLLKYR